MTNKLKWPTPPARRDLPVAVSKPKGFRLPDPAKRKAAGIRERQLCSTSNRNTAITLPTLSILRDDNGQKD